MFARHAQMQKDTLSNYSARQRAWLPRHTPVVSQHLYERAQPADSGSTNDWHPIKSLLRKRLGLTPLELNDRRWALPSDCIANYPGLVSFFYSIRFLVYCNPIIANGVAFTLTRSLVLTLG